MPGLNRRRPAALESRGRSVLGSRITTTILVLALLVLAACGTRSSETQQPSPTPRPGDVGWKVLGAGAFPSRATLMDIAVRDGTVVVIGEAVSVGDDSAPALPIWSSTDGGVWHAATIEGTASGTPVSIVTFGDGFVAVGMDGCTSSAYHFLLEGCESAVWRSSDGLAWTRVNLDAPPDSELTAVTAWKDGLLAVGGRLATTGTVTSELPVLFRSSDGSTWERLSPSEGLDRPLTDVVASDEMLIAVSPSGSGTGELMPVAWSSTDGSTWTRETLPGTASSSSQWVLASTMPGGFAALNVQVSSGATFATSVWRRDTAWHAISGATEISGARLIGLASGPYGGLVVGLDEAFRPVIYASQDGAAWGPVSPVGELPSENFGVISATWAQGQFYVTGVDIATYQPVVLVGMAYVPKPGEIAYVTPAPTPTPTLGPTPMPPPQNATGLAHLVLKSISHYTAPIGGAAQCVSYSGGQGLSEVTIYDAGLVAGQPTNATLSFQGVPATEGSAAQLYLTAVPLDNGGEQSRAWNLQGTVTTLGAAGMTGSVTLDNGTGSVSWMCGPWFDPTVQAPFEGNFGYLTLTSNATGWIASTQQATCSLEPDGSIAGVSGVAGFLKGVASFTVNLPLQSRSLVGEHLVAHVTSSASQQMGALALVTITKLGFNDLAGEGTFSLRFAAPSEGWPKRLDGTLSWRCPGRTDTDEKPMAACELASDLPVGVNLAAGKESTASATHPSAQQSYAFDGDPTSAWSSGTNAIQWIEVDLGKPIQVGEVRLVVAQGDQPGHTEHHLYGRTGPDGPLVQLAACAGSTADNERLVLSISSKAPRVRYLRIETVATPSWVAWREIEVYATP